MGGGLTPGPTSLSSWSSAAPVMRLGYLSRLLHSRVAHASLSKRHLSNHRHVLLGFLGEPSASEGNTLGST